MITDMAVVIPANNEEDLIGLALTAVRRSLHDLREHHPDVSATVVVVLDACTDRTAEIVAEFAEFDTVTCSHGRVGAARAAGVDRALAATDSPHSWWIATTDADSVVPPHWLRHHLLAARSGITLLRGTVRPDLAGAALHRWLDRHDIGDHHPHVHGANLGLTATLYRAAGGFPDVAEHEDQILVRRAREAGAVEFASGSAAVLTSSRVAGRTPGGMAAYLRDLAG